MRVGARTWSWRSLVVAVATACVLHGCHSESFDESSYRLARRARSAVALAKYIEDDLRDDFKDDARALLDKLFAHQLEHIGQRRNADLARTLIRALRAAGDPRITVEVTPPRLTGKLSVSAVRYFQDQHAWDYWFADGASLGAGEVFPRQVLMFATASGIDFDPGKAGAHVVVDWSVSPTGTYYGGPLSIATMGKEPDPIQGLAIEATLRFTLRDERNRSVEVEVSGSPPAEVSFRAMNGFASDDDVYAGMVEATFADAVSNMFAELDPASGQSESD